MDKDKILQDLLNSKKDKVIKNKVKDENEDIILDVTESTDIGEYIERSKDSGDSEIARRTQMQEDAENEDGSEEKQYDENNKFALNEEQENYTSSILSNTTVKQKKRKNKDNVEIDGGEINVITKSVEQVLHDSMLPYSEFVIMDRALPRVEDGLKPVQRRVLYSMLEVGVLPDRPFRKSARIVGDCMGKYHPHGDRSIYDTMVRLAQDFNMGEILVSGHGNFGSIDGDCAAAMRYTEARLSPIAMELLKDIEKDTVPWSFNFDDSCKEPDMLPGRFPNLLVNGAYGIAVGLATNIPTHNLRETCNAVCAYIENKNISLSELMKLMPGPDFPTGAYILNNSELKDVYKTGKGRIYVRSKLHIETAEGGKKNIVITEIPFQVNKAAMLQKIAGLKENDQTGILANITDIVDESDRNGLRAVIKLKKEAKIGSILALLFKNSDLQTTFNANIVAIADGKPKQMGLIEIIDYYVNYQQQIIYRRTKFDLEACLKKEHILEGLLIAINNIDEVVRIIKQSKSVTDAKITLIQRFSLSEAQAQAILDMRLARLTNLEVDKLIAELNRLKDLIKRYTAILKSPALQMRIVKQELQVIAKTYGSDRKTQFINASEDLPIESSEEDSDEQSNEINIVTTPIRTIKSVTQKNYNLSTKELSSNSNLAEIPELSIKTIVKKDIYLFTNLGNCIKVPAEKIGICKFKDRGSNISAYYGNLEDDEKVVSIFDFDESNSKDKLIFFTLKGMIKISTIEEYFASKQSISAIKLKDGDQLLNVEFEKTDAQVGLFTHNGYGMLVPKDDIESTARVSIGIKGINLTDDDYIVGAKQFIKGDAVVILTDDGLFKAIKYQDIQCVSRNKRGPMILSNKIKGKLLKAEIYDMNNSFVLEEQNGNLTFLGTQHIPVDKPENMGKSLKNLRGEHILKNVYNYKIN